MNYIALTAIVLIMLNRYNLLPSFPGPLLTVYGIDFVIAIIFKIVVNVVIVVII